MGINDWIRFITVFALGIALVQVSHGKILDTSKLNFKFSPGFMKTIRYMGLFIIVYSSYGVIIDYVVAS